MISGDGMVVIVDYGSQPGRKGQNRGGVMVQGRRVKGRAFEDERVKELRA